MKQVSTEVASKRMKEIVEQHVSQGETVTAARREGVVCLDMVPFVLVLPQASGETLCKWNEPLLVKAKLTKATLIKLFEEATALALLSGGGSRALRAKMENIEWCS